MTLNFLAKYIRNKQVNNGKVNDFGDFDGMGDAIWNFLSSIYKAKWDVLYTDQKSNTLRTKISLKFTPRTISPNNDNKKNIPKSVLMTINKVPPPLPHPAKSKKEINTISKYFNPKKSTVNNPAHGTNVSSSKSYCYSARMWTDFRVRVRTE